LLSAASFSVSEADEDVFAFFRTVGFAAPFVFWAFPFFLMLVLNLVTRLAERPVGAAAVHTMTRQACVGERQRKEEGGGGTLPPQGLRSTVASQQSRRVEHALQFEVKEVGPRSS